MIIKAWVLCSAHSVLNLNSRKHVVIEIFENSEVGVFRDTYSSRIVL